MIRINFPIEPSTSYDIQKRLPDDTWADFAIDTSSIPLDDPSGNKDDYYRARTHDGSPWTPAFRGEDYTPNMCRLYGRILKADGSVIKDANINFRLANNDLIDDIMYSVISELDAFVDSSGEWEQLLPVGSTIIINVAETQFNETVIVPNMTECPLSNLL